MAQMIPDSVRDRVIFASRAEEKVYELLRAQLGSQWRVFYSCSLSSFEDGHGLRDNEIDFVLYHPRLGIVVIEVKGGRIHYEAVGNNFFSVDRFGKTFAIKNPFQQALVWRSRLVKYLKKQRIKVPISHAVCLPNVYENDLPKSAAFEPEILIGRNKLTHLEQALKLLVQRSHPEKFLKFSDVGDQIQRLLIGRDFTTRLYIRDYIDSHEFRLKDVETLHESFISPVASARRLGIEGEAGTGKTMLALSLARYFRNQGCSVLLLSSNQLLNVFLKHEAGARVDVRSYTELAMQFGVNLLSPPQGYKGNYNDWVQYDAPEKLGQALSSSKTSYDVVLCDEAQDVQPFWWDVIERLLSAKGRLYVFFDRSQGVFGSGGDGRHFVPEEVLPVEPPYFPLVNNYRTTREIAAFSRAFRTGKQILESYSSRLGYLPEIVLYDNEDDARRKLEILVAKLVKQEGLKPGEVTLLSARKPNVAPSVIAGYDTLANIPLNYLSAKYGKKTFLEHYQSDSVNVSTIAAFKGLETKVGILLNISEYRMPLSNPLMASLAYVACTRAKHMLYVFVQRNDLKRKAFEKALRSIKANGALVLNRDLGDHEFEGEVIYFNPERVGWLSVNDPAIEEGRIMFFPSDLSGDLADVTVGDHLRFRLRKEGDVLIAVDLQDAMSGQSAAARKPTA